MDHEKYKSANRSRTILVLLAIIFIGGIWYMFLRDGGIGTGGASDILVGEWLRSDGTYMIEITEVMDEGKMTAAYFNPGPIHVGSAGWRVKDDQLQVYVELKDENYPGSFYDLKYNDQTGKLGGTYYQAVSKQTYNVEFNKK